jgi:hypothetical protein
MIAVAVLMALVCAAAAKEQLRIGVLHKPESCDRKTKSGDKVSIAEACRSETRRVALAPGFPLFRE